MVVGIHGTEFFGPSFAIVFAFVAFDTVSSFGFGIQLVTGSVHPFIRLERTAFVAFNELECIAASITHGSISGLCLFCF